MLKQRVITALILIPLVVLAVLKLPTDYFACILVFIIALGAWEWSALSGFESSLARVSYVALILFGCLCVYFYFQDGWKNGLIYFSLLTWLLAFISVVAHQKQWFNLPSHRILRALMGIMVVLPAWLSLVLLHENPEQGTFFVLLLFILIWTADSAAYFAGRRWGKNKLASRVSPGKSWEGVLAAVVTSAFLGAAFAWWQEMTKVSIVAFSILSLITVACSVMGDLFESLVKRTANIKDSGTILPGHGGIMDRIDSLTVAAPVFLVGLSVLGGIS